MISSADLSRAIIASQTHRRMIDPMSFRRWSRPFVIERPHTAAASSAVTGSGIASAPAGDAPARAGDGK